MDEAMDSGYAAPVKPPAEATPQSVDEENAGATEILVSKSQLPSGSKEGDTLTFKIAKDYGDEVSLELAEETPPGETQEDLSATAAKEIAALDTAT